MPTKYGTKKGSYSGIPPSAGKIHLSVNTSVGMSDPRKAEEIIYKEVLKSIKKSKLVRDTNKYFNDITRNWSARGEDKSRVKFKTIVGPGAKSGIDIRVVMTGPQQGMDRFDMIDFKGRNSDVVISVSGTTTKVVSQESGKDTFGFTQAEELFDVHKSSKGGKRKRGKAGEREFQRFGVSFEDPITGDKFTRKVKQTRRKVMPLADYEKKAQGPWQIPGSGKKERMPKGQGQYATRVVQGEVKPLFYTKAYLKEYIVGNSDFRRLAKNAAARALRRVMRQKRAKRAYRIRKEHKARVKAGKSPAYKGKGNYIGRARRTGPRGSNTATSKQRVK